MDEIIGRKVKGVVVGRGVALRTFRLPPENNLNPFTVYDDSAGDATNVRSTEDDESPADGDFSCSSNETGLLDEIFSEIVELVR